jgi:predicted DNA-binding transcriptional regulator AlpA
MIEELIKTTVAEAINVNFGALKEQLHKEAAFPEVMTQGQLAKYLGVSQSTIIEKQRSAGLPVSYALGEKSPRYFKAEVDKWLKGQI